MPSSLQISLPDEMHRFVQERTSGKDAHSTPGDYVRELIRREMDNHGAVARLNRGMEDFRNGRYSEKSIEDYIATPQG